MNFVTVLLTSMTPTFFFLHTACGSLCHEDCLENFIISIMIHCMRHVMKEINEEVSQLKKDNKHDDFRLLYSPSIVHLVSALNTF